jgi:sterol 24-C-methyltransferase
MAKSKSKKEASSDNQATNEASKPARGEIFIPDDYTGDYSTKYRKHFEAQINRHGDTSAEEREARMKEATKVADDYYNFVSPFYENGWNQTFHYCPLTPGLGIDDSMKVYDEHFAKRLDLKPGMKVLDVGCGIGGPARTIARATGAHIIGITINKWHVDRGTALTRQAGLLDKVTLVQGDFLKLPFDDASFDAVYAFDALCYAANVRDVYREIWRVLKPGGPFAFHDWVMTPKFDANNRKHCRIRNQIEFGNGITNMPLLVNVRSGLKEVGFEILRDENMALAPAPYAPSRPWYYGPAGYFWYSVGWSDWWKVFKMSSIFLAVMSVYTWLAVPLGMMPPEMREMAHTMLICCRSVVSGGSTGIFSPMWVCECRKPGDAEKNEAKQESAMSGDE